MLYIVPIFNLYSTKDLFNFMGISMGRPRKNRKGLLGRAGRQAIELEDIERESRRWKRRKATIERFAIYQD